MNKLLERRNEIYGICAVWIVLFHVFRRIGMPYIPIITNIVGIGNMAVDVFFFFSGLCLSLSAEKHHYISSGWGGYFRKRFVRILIPYLIICIPYYLWSAIFEKSGGIAHKVLLFFGNLSSATFWLKGTQTTWFVFGIAVFYLLFPLLFVYSSKSRWIKRLGLLLGMIGFAILTAYLPILKNSTIVWARLPIFTIGVIVGIDKDSVRAPGKAWFVAAIVLFIALGWLISLCEISESVSIPQVYRLLIYIPMTLSLMMILSKLRGRIRVFDWIGGLSLEIYLIHITLLHPIKYYGIMDKAGCWLYLILPVISILLAWVVRKIENLILVKKGV